MPPLWPERIGPRFVVDARITDVLLVGEASDARGGRKAKARTEIELRVDMRRADRCRRRSECGDGGASTKRETCTPTTDRKRRARLIERRACQVGWVKFFVSERSERVENSVARSVAGDTGDGRRCEFF